MNGIAKDIKKIGITYNLKEMFFPTYALDSEYTEEFDQPETIDAICDVFNKNGYEIVKLGGDINVVGRLKKEKVDFVFNIAEGYYGRNREGHIPAILEMMHIPYSGSDPLTLALTLDKTMAKRIALQIGIPTPRYEVVRKIDDLADLDNKLAYPLITKPAWEGSSKGIYNTSSVYDKEALEQNVVLLLGKYPKQPVIVEEYIKGREITVVVIGNKVPVILGIMEITSKNHPQSDFLYSLEVKRNWKKEAEYIVPPQINEMLEGYLRDYAIVAFKEFGCRDFARIDFRISEDNKVYLLEINPLPGLSPEYSDLVIMSKKLGIVYEDIILSILYQAFYRYGIIKGSDKIIKIGKL